MFCIFVYFCPDFFSISDFVFVLMLKALKKGGQFETHLGK